jgi:hypothetical protein
MDPDTLYDKVLGMLLGSAIGDAMGAPTEMWSRQDIQATYGHVTGLQDQVRSPSAEGPWAVNLPAGGTTDDTRWKALAIDFLSGPGSPRPLPAQLDEQAFARFLVDRYLAGQQRLRAESDFLLDPYESHLQELAWLKEWVQVAHPYGQGDHAAYQQALHRFYGGEMVCGGMLFGPLIGAAYPGAPGHAYEQAVALNIFDIGYARDVAGLTAALTAAAMVPGARPDSVLAVMRTVDPLGYFRARLVNRTAWALYQDARRIAFAARQADPAEILAAPPVKLALEPQNEADSLRYARTSVAYQLLDQKLERLPFHPGEIHLVYLTALILWDFDVAEALPFIVNFGRDNDTSAAVAGAILGAYHGASGLPAEWKAQVLAAQQLQALDLEALARRLTDSILAAQAS